MAAVFNPPPGWPEPPSGWTPPPGWLPAPEWPPAPAGWQFWSDRPVEDPATPAGDGPSPRDTIPGQVQAGSRSTATYGGPALSTPSAPAVASGATVLTWLGWGGLAVVALLGLAGGLGGAIVMAGLYAFAVALVALLRGRVGWALLRNRATAAGALAMSVVVMGVGGAVSPAATPDVEEVAAPARTATPSSTPASATPTPTATPTPVDPVQSALDQAEAGTVLALLATVRVVDGAGVPGYARAEFGQLWRDTDRNGCDQRNDTLRRDLAKVTLKAGSHGCAVWTGTLTDPYTGEPVTFTRVGGARSAVAIDHVVPLADAWGKGASTWPAKKRAEFANDTLNLLATATAVNAAKSAGDATQWLPPDPNARCGYLARQVAVKAKYGLAVSPDERKVMALSLQGCADTSVPEAVVAKLGGWPTYAAPVPLVAKSKVTRKPTTSSPTTTSRPRTTSKPRATTKPKAPSYVRGVHPGAFCSPAGALGLTSKGTLMKCSFKAGDSRARWRAA